MIWAQFCLSNFKKGKGCGTSLVVQWLGLHPSTTRGMGSIPGWGTKILHAMQQKKKKKIRMPVV